MQKLSGESQNTVAENIEKLKALFPDAVSEGRVIWDDLKADLGELIETREERYSFNWSGKANARRIAQTPSTGTLRPAKDESVDWETTQNLFIEGDNLEVLKLLQKSYHSKVKMIYIDPPYNTGNEFIYPDNFRDNIENYLSLTGQRDADGRKLGTNAETSGRYHTNWLNMIYPRLKLARNLLRDDGMIFISIDDNEVHNLRKICDEIFGEGNFVASIFWQGGRKNDAKRFSVVHDYILVYVKSESYLQQNGVKWREKKQGLDNIYKKVTELKNKHNDDYESASKELKEWFDNLPESAIEKEHAHYTKIDGSGVFYGDNITSPNYRKNLIFEYKGYQPPDNGWRYNLEAMKRLDEDGLLLFPKNKDGRIQYKRYLHHTETWAPSTWFYKDRRAASKQLISLMEGNFFDFPKDIQVLMRYLKTFSDNNDIVLDFFSGSGSTAHAVMKLNAEDGGNRRCISVQLPEPCDEKSEAYKAGYQTIAEISKERIRRAAKKIAEENPDAACDLGFKVFKLDSSNIKAWDVDFDNVEQSLLDAVDNIKVDRTSEDLLYEILLKYGLDLTLAIEAKEVAGKTAYVIGLGALVICLDEDITLDTVEAIAALKDEYKPYYDEEKKKLHMRVVFKDASFANDVVKTNAIQILKQHGIDDVKSV